MVGSKKVGVNGMGGVSGYERAGGLSSGVVVGDFSNRAVVGEYGAAADVKKVITNRTHSELA